MTQPAVLNRLADEPADVELLLDLGQEAVRDDAWVDELFDRFDRALAAPGADRGRLRWAQVCHAALFGRPEVIESALADRDFTRPDEPLRCAKVGGLLIELGRRAAAEQLLGGTAHPLASYHRRRLATDAAERARLLGELPGDGANGPLRRVAEAEDGLAAGDLEAARALVAWWTGPEADPAQTPSHIAAELILCEARLLVAEGRHDDAIRAEIFFVVSPSRYDPSAILRATALLGPLPRRYR